MFDTFQVFLYNNRLHQEKVQLKIADDAINVIMLICKQPGMVDPEAVKIQNIQHIVPLPKVRIHDAIWHDLGFIISINMAEAASRMILMYTLPPRLS
ncbi:MAG: hypothetical protein HRT36_04490 [Alphaproteobacteria bacterium]|nr:hypothetical protein [Alphaproteobacteria bacterium]